MPLSSFRFLFTSCHMYKWVSGPLTCHLFLFLERWPLCVGVSRWSDCTLDDAHVNAAEDVKCAAVVSRSGISCVSLLCAAHDCPGRGDLRPFFSFFSLSFLPFPFLLTASLSCLQRYLLATVGCGFCLFDVLTGDSLLKCPKAHNSSVQHIMTLYNK